MLSMNAALSPSMQTGETVVVAGTVTPLILSLRLSPQSPVHDLSLRYLTESELDSLRFLHMIRAVWLPCESSGRKKMTVATLPYGALSVRVPEYSPPTYRSRTNSPVLES